MLKPLSFSRRAAKAKIGTAKASPVSTATGRRAAPTTRRTRRTGPRRPRRSAAPVNRWQATDGEVAAEHLDDPQRRGEHRGVHLVPLDVAHDRRTSTHRTPPSSPASRGCRARRTAGRARRRRRRRCRRPARPGPAPSTAGRTAATGTRPMIDCRARCGGRRAKWCPMTATRAARRWSVGRRAPCPGRPLGGASATRSWSRRPSVDQVRPVRWRKTSSSVERRTSDDSGSTPRRVDDRASAASPSSA